MLYLDTGATEGLFQLHAYISKLLSDRYVKATLDNGVD